jgi:hypothetical protein
LLHHRASVANAFRWKPLCSIEPLVLASLDRPHPTLPSVDRKSGESVFFCIQRLFPVSWIAKPGLPDGKCIFKQKIRFLVNIPNGLAIQDVGIFYWHLVYFTDIWYILRKFGIFYRHLVFLRRFDIFCCHLVYFINIWYICCRLVYFVAIWYILRQFGIFWGNLVYFSPFWYCVPKKIWQPLIALEPCLQTDVIKFYPSFVYKQTLLVLMPWHLFDLQNICFL